MRVDPSPTPYSETNALLAILQEDEDSADEILKGMLSNELLALSHAAATLASMARCEARDQRRSADETA